MVRYILKYLTTLPQMHRLNRGINVVRCRGDYRCGVGLDIGFIDHLNTQLVTTSNYSAIAISTLYKSPYAISSPACSVFTTLFLVTASNIGDSSASCAQVLSLQTFIQN
jgi:hypothetical protein